MKDEKLTKALNEIANKEIPNNMSIWNKIENQHEQPQKRTIILPRFRLPTSAIATIVIALVTVSSVIAYTLLTREALENTTFPVEQGEIPLDAGTFTEIIVPDGASNTTWLLGESTFGDLDGDEIEDAAAILIQNTGGSGTFHYLYAIRNNEGEPEYMADLFLGDRIQLNSIQVIDNAIVVDYVKVGPNDSLCCPTLQVLETYQVLNNELELINN